MQLYLFWGVREPPNLTVDGTSYVATVALFGTSRVWREEKRDLLQAAKYQAVIHLLFSLSSEMHRTKYNEFSRKRGGVSRYLL